MVKRLNIKKPDSEITPLSFTEFFGQDTIQKAAEIYDRLQRPLMTGVDTGINLRNLNNWLSVLEKSKREDRKTYSFTEFIWYKMVEQLREIGFSLEDISNLKSKLLEPIKIKGVVSKFQQSSQYVNDLKLSKENKDKLLQLISRNIKEIDESSTFNILHFLIIESTLKEIPISLAVFKEGSFIIIDKTKEHLYSEKDKEKLAYEAHVIISTSTILRNFLISDLADYILQEIGLLSHSENKLFEFIHNGEYISMTIYFKDKKINPIELKKNKKIKERVVDILMKNAFKEIIIQKHRNYNVKIESTKKITL